MSAGAAQRGSHGQRRAHQRLCVPRHFAVRQRPSHSGRLRLDHRHFYAGVWGSSTDLRPVMEIDLYAGFTPTTGPVEWDIGLVGYFYPGGDDDDVREFDYFEGIVGASFTSPSNSASAASRLHAGEFRRHRRRHLLRDQRRVRPDDAPRSAPPTAIRDIDVRSPTPTTPGMSAGPTRSTASRSICATRHRRCFGYRLYVGRSNYDAASCSRSAANSNFDHGQKIGPSQQCGGPFACFRSAKCAR